MNPAPKRPTFKEQLRARPPERPAIAPADDVVEFVRQAMQDEYYIELVRRQLYSVNKPDNEIEAIMSEITSIAESYLRKNGKPWSLRTTYQSGFVLVSTLLEGKVDRIDDPKSIERLKKSPYID